MPLTCCVTAVLPDIAEQGMERARVAHQLAGPQEQLDQTKPRWRSRSPASA